MGKPPQISDAEWEIMEVLWAASPRTANDVAEAVCERMQWHPKTVKTLLGRLVKKGALKFKEEANRYLYRPTFAREKYIAEESKTFVDRVFGGEATPMLVHFVETMELSDDEIQELRAILDRKGKEEGR